MRAYIRMMQQQKQVVTDTLIEQVRLETVIDVRHQVLRATQPRHSCYYPEDSYKNTIHFAASINDKIIACASVYKESHPDFKLRQSWRIRGMAVLESYQGQSIGTQLLKVCINHAIKNKADVIWCNARMNAVKFYKQAGFKIIGDEYEIANIGPHYLLAKNLGIHHSQFKFLQIAKKIFANEQPLPQPKQKS